MAVEKLSPPEPLKPVTVTVVGTGDGTLKQDTIAVTPHAQEPNIIVTVVTPLTAIAIRFVYTFGGQLVGLLTAAMTPAGAELLYTGDFFALLVTCASLSLPWALLDLLKNIVGIAKGLENKYPLLTGNV